MRTKHLLWALALPAVFAACTNDDFESVVQDNNALQGRPMAGDVELNFDFGNADTRLTTNFEFEEGDEIGATLMDEYVATGVTDYNIWGIPANQNIYKFVDYIQTNYRYTNTANGWENSNLLCSGNYFFYYPYTAQLNTRVAFEKYLNPNQVLKEESSAGARQVVIDNQMFVGYKLVEGATEGSTQVLNVSMQQVFAAPLFTIMCTDSEPVTIQKIALQYIKKDKDMPLMAVVDPTNTERNTTTVSGVSYVDFEKDPTSAVRMANPATEKPQLDKDAVIGARQIQVTMPEGTTTSNGDPVNVYMVIPAGDYTATGNEGPVELLIYTNKGLVTADLSVAHENTGSTGGQNNVTNDVAMGVVSGTMKATRHINITFDEVAINNPDEFAATSTEDLDTYVAWSAQIGGVKNMWIKSTGKETKLSAASVATLAKNKNITMNVLGDITIAEDVKSEDFAAAQINFLGGTEATKLKYGADNKVTGVEDLSSTSGQTIYNQATLTLADGWQNPTDGDITLVNDGMLTLRGASYTIDFVNNGNINVSSAQTNGTVSFTLTANNEDFVNNGIVDINSDMMLTSNYGIGNNGTISIHRGTTYGKIENLFTQNPAGGCHFGYIKVAEDATWVLRGIDAYNNGQIDNKGTINVPTGTVYINNEDRNYTNVLGKADVWTPLVNNDGTLAGITNNGLVVQGANAAYSTNGVNGATGEVDNTAVSGRTVASDGETIFVKVVEAANAKALNKKLADAQAELVRFVDAGSLTIAEADYAEGENSFTLTIPTVEIEGDLTISTPVGKELNIYKGEPGETTINITKGTTTITEQSKVSLGTKGWGSTIKLAKGTLLNVNNNATLTSECNIKFKGEGMVGNYGAITNVKKDQEPKLTTGSNKYTTVE